MFMDRARPGGRRGRGLDSTRSGVDYELERLRRELTTAITVYMEDRDTPLTKRELAGLMQVTPGRVSQILAGDDNLTLRSLAAVCVALDARFHVELVPNKNASDAAVVTFGERGEPATAGIETADLPPSSLPVTADPGRRR